MAASDRLAWLAPVVLMVLYVSLVSGPFVAFAAPQSRSRDSAADLEPCTASNCKLPTCFCSGTTPPGGLAPANSPQIVMLTFDDNVNTQVYDFQKQILSGQYKNPNGCPMTATFFVCHEYTDYYTVEYLYTQRNEIADHTITHRTPTTWWANATVDEWRGEIAGMKTILEMFANIPAANITGFRAPYLQAGGDRQFSVLKEQSFVYDSTMPTCKYVDPPMYPYTLDYARTEECMIPPCPTQSYPGMWEVPLVGLESDRTGQCYSMVDAFTPTSVDDAYQFLRANFDRHYKSNRAPYGIFMHAAWFLQHPNEAFPAVEKLIGELAAMDDVWLVSVAQMLDWMRSPQALTSVKDFAPFQCTAPVMPPVCAESAAYNCHFTDMNGDGGDGAGGGGEGGALCAEYTGERRPLQALPSLCKTDMEHYMRTCSPCPAHYPWYGNPTGK
ncbi:chitin deacetylase 7-like [Sycon ciliatum]|uniref:chitin deacetylase 7-like n=1 Tax=Sycon ciliatum TaxID=27933 RepID=UPI0031F65710